MNIDAILDDLGDSIVELARNTVGDYVDQARSDFGDFVDNTRAKLQLWAEAAAHGQLSRDELALLLRMRAANTELHALTALGLAQIRLERFRKGVISLLVRSIFNAI